MDGLLPGCGHAAASTQDCTARLPHTPRPPSLPCPCPCPPTLQLFTNSAAALPAEMDEHGQMKAQPGAMGAIKGAWQRRMEATAERRRQQKEARKTAQ